MSKQERKPVTSYFLFGAASPVPFFLFSSYLSECALVVAAFSFLFFSFFGINCTVFCVFLEAKRCHHCWQMVENK